MGCAHSCRRNIVLMLREAKDSSDQPIAAHGSLWCRHHAPIHCSVPTMNFATFLLWHQSLSLYRRYLIAICIVLIAFALRYLSLPLDSGNQVGMFYPAVALSFLIGGTGPGILSTAASALLAHYFFFAPYNSFAFGSDAVIPLTVFAVTSLAFGYTLNAMRDFRSKAIAFDASLASELGGTSWDQLKIATDGANIGFWRWNVLDDTVLLSDICCDMYGLPHQVASLTYQQFYERIIPEDRDWIVRSRSTSFLSHKDFAAEFRTKWPDGTIHWISSIGRPLFSEDGILVRVDFVMLDIEQRKRFEHKLVEINLDAAKDLHAKTDGLVKANEALTALSRVDVLTGLANRLGVNERVRSSFARLKRYKEPFAVLMIDIDLFNALNDAHGHLVGDDVLRVMGETLKKNLRENDFAGRYGGEEFLVLLPSADTSHAGSVAEKLRAAMEAIPHPVAGTVTVSIGVAVSSLDCHDEYATTAEADRQLYVAKHAGRNRVSLQGDSPSDSLGGSSVASTNETPVAAQANGLAHSLQKE
jgi:diguanylate cyclase (GGDEF)-like protein